jgi:uncharacterized protein (DUF433 family)
MIFGMMKDQPIVSGNRDVMGCTAVFHGTQVPVQTPLDLEGFPSVMREHVIAFLEEAKDRIV